MPDIGLPIGDLFITIDKGELAAIKKMCDETIKKTGDVGVARTSVVRRLVLQGHDRCRAVDLVILSNRSGAM